MGGGPTLTRLVAFALEEGSHVLQLGVRVKEASGNAGRVPHRRVDHAHAIIEPDLFACKCEGWKEINCHRYLAPNPPHNTESLLW